MRWALPNSLEPKGGLEMKLGGRWEEEEGDLYLRVQGCLWEESWGSMTCVLLQLENRYWQQKQSLGGEHQNWGMCSWFGQQNWEGGVALTRTWPGKSPCAPQAQQRNVNSQRMEGVSVSGGCWSLLGWGGTLVPVPFVPQGWRGAGPGSLAEYHEHRRAAQWKPVTQETCSARGGSSEIL